MSHGALHAREHRSGTAVTLDDCVMLIDKCAAAARGSAHVIVLCHGARSLPEDSAYVLQQHGHQWFLVGSSMERLPTEQAEIADRGVQGGAFD